MSAPTSLGDLLKAIDDELALLVPGVTVNFGEEFLARNDAPPRVVWIPEPDTYERGQEKHGAGALQRSLATCEAAVSAHCWAVKDPADTATYADLTATWNLVRRLISCCRKVVGASFTIRGGVFDPGGYTQLGRLYVLKVSFRLPVVEDLAWQALKVVAPGAGVPGTSTDLHNTVTPPNP